MTDFLYHLLINTAGAERAQGFFAPNYFFFTTLGSALRIKCSLAKLATARRHGRMAEGDIFVSAEDAQDHSSKTALHHESHSRIHLEVISVRDKDCDNSKLCP